MNSELPYLRIWCKRRPWWLLWLVWWWEELEMSPPPDATFADVVEWADRLRSHGARVEVVRR